MPWGTEAVYTGEPIDDSIGVCRAVSTSRIESVGGGYDQPSIIHLEVKA